jgi:hypothetical protein
VDPVHDDDPGAEPLAWCSIVLARGVGEAKFHAFVFEADGRRSLIACSEAFPLTRASGARDRGAPRHAHDVLVARFESLGWTRIATAGRWHDTALVLRAFQKPPDNADETSAPAAEPETETAPAAEVPRARPTAAPTRNRASRPSPKRGAAGPADRARTNRRATGQPAGAAPPEPQPAAPPEPQAAGSADTPREPHPAPPPELQAAESADIPPEPPPAGSADIPPGTSPPSRDAAGPKSKGPKAQSPKRQRRSKITDSGGKK